MKITNEQYKEIVLMKNYSKNLAKFLGSIEDSEIRYSIEDYLDDIINLKELKKIISKTES